MSLMKRLKPLAFVLLTAFALSGCAGVGETDGSILQGVEPLLQRHDVYAVRLMETEALGGALGQTARIRAFLRAHPTGAAPVGVIREDGTQVIDRHQGWVKADGALTETERRVFLRSGEVFKGLLED